MNQIYEEGYLLAIRLEGDAVILRLDRYGLADHEKTAAQKPIVTLTLSGITDKAKRDELLCLPDDGSITVEVSQPTDGIYCVSVEEPRFIEMGCAAANQEESDYTPQELLEKFRRLSDLYHSDWNRDTIELGQAQRFQEELLRGIGRERERCERKRDFFQKIEPAKSGRLDAQIQAYNRVLTIMEFLNKKKASLPKQKTQRDKGNS